MKIIAGATKPVKSALPGWQQYDVRPVSLSTLNGRPATGRQMSRTANNWRVSEILFIYPLRLKRFPFLRLPGVQGPGWSKSRVPVGWPLTWTNRPVTGRAKSPTVTSSRVSRRIGWWESERLYIVMVLHRRCIVSLVLFYFIVFTFFYFSFSFSINLTSM